MKFGSCTQFKVSSGIGLNSRFETLHVKCNCLDKAHWSVLDLYLVGLKGSSTAKLLSIVLHFFKLNYIVLNKFTCPPPRCVRCSQLLP